LLRLLRARARRHVRGGGGSRRARFKGRLESDRPRTPPSSCPRSGHPRNSRRLYLVAAFTILKSTRNDQGTWRKLQGPALFRVSSHSPGEAHVTVNAYGILFQSVASTIQRTLKKTKTKKIYDSEALVYSLLRLHLCLGERVFG
jgi:hypothetical protein